MGQASIRKASNSTCTCIEKFLKSNRFLDLIRLEWSLSDNNKWLVLYYSVYDNICIKLFYKY